MHGIKINGAKNQLFDTKRVSQKLIDFASKEGFKICLLYTSPSPRDGLLSRMPSSA